MKLPPYDSLQRFIKTVRALWLETSQRETDGESVTLQSREKSRLCFFPADRRRLRLIVTMFFDRRRYGTKRVSRAIARKSTHRTPENLTPGKYHGGQLYIEVRERSEDRPARAQRAGFATLETLKSCTPGIAVGDSRGAECNL